MPIYFSYNKLSCAEHSRFFGHHRVFVVITTGCSLMPTSLFSSRVKTGSDRLKVSRYRQNRFYGFIVWLLKFLIKKPTSSRGNTGSQGCKASRISLELRAVEWRHDYVVEKCMYTVFQGHDAWNGSQPNCSVSIFNIKVTCILNLSV